MKPGHRYLIVGIILSMMLHCGVVWFFSSMGSMAVKQRTMPPSLLVPVSVTTPVKPPEPAKPKQPLPKPPPPRKKVMKKMAKKKVKQTQPIAKPNPVPVSHKRSTTEPPAKPEEVKPVFGVSRKTVADATAGSMAVRVGNTLMKEQEEEYTPPEKVRDYITVPVFELTTLPEFRQKITPNYPESLKKEEREGEVALSVTIDDTGTVTDVRILRATHMLFAKASVEAVKKSRFKPATLNGSAVGTVLDDLIYTFILED